MRAGNISLALAVFGVGQVLAADRAATGTVEA